MTFSGSQSIIYRANLTLTGDELTANTGLPLQAGKQRLFTCPLPAFESQQFELISEHFL